MLLLMYLCGQIIDVIVLLIGDVKSICGGILLLIQLYGVDGEVYVLVQGSVVVGGMNVIGVSGFSVMVNMLIVGLIFNGVMVECEIFSDFQMGDIIIFNLKCLLFKDVNNIVVVINVLFGGIVIVQSFINVIVCVFISFGVWVVFML